MTKPTSAGCVAKVLPHAVLFQFPFRPRLQLPCFSSSLSRVWLKMPCFSSSLSRAWLKMLCFSTSFSSACTKSCVFPVPFLFPSSLPEKYIKIQELQSCLRKGVGKAQQLQSRLRKGNGRRPELNQQSARKDNVSRNKKNKLQTRKNYPSHSLRSCWPPLPVP